MNLLSDKVVGEVGISGRGPAATQSRMKVYDLSQLVRENDHDRQRLANI